MVECDVPLRSGCDMLVSLSVYICPPAFKRYQPSSSENSSPKHWLNEGTESQHEQTLRERKTALRQLFKKLGLKPRTGKDVAMENGDLSSKSSKANGSGEKGTRKDNAVSVDDPDENDEEVLSDNDLDVIYKRLVDLFVLLFRFTLIHVNRAQANDAAMDEMDPSSDFTLSLRPYQRQALQYEFIKLLCMVSFLMRVIGSWMYSRETGAASARKSNSIHPLWSE